MHGGDDELVWVVGLEVEGRGRVRNGVDALDGFVERAFLDVEDGVYQRTVVVWISQGKFKVLHAVGRVA